MPRQKSAKPHTLDEENSLHPFRIPELPYIFVINTQAHMLTLVNPLAQAHELPILTQSRFTETEMRILYCLFDHQDGCSYEQILETVRAPYQQWPGQADLSPEPAEVAGQRGLKAIQNILSVLRIKLNEFGLAIPPYDYASGYRIVALSPTADGAPVYFRSGTPSVLS